RQAIALDPTCRPGTLAGTDIEQNPTPAHGAGHAIDVGEGDPALIHQPADSAVRADHAVLSLDSATTARRERLLQGGENPRLVFRKDPVAMLVTGDIRRRVQAKYDAKLRGPLHVTADKIVLIDSQADRLSHIALLFVRKNRA